METYSASALVNSWENEAPKLIAPSDARVEVQIALPLE